MPVCIHSRVFVWVFVMSLCLTSICIVAAQSESPNGDGTIEIGGELRAWHKVTLTLNGPFAREMDTRPNPFTDYAMQVRFRHESGTPDYTVPGYFAADGRAGETSADSGTQWRAHLSPDKPGRWSYEVTFMAGHLAAVGGEAIRPLVPWHGLNGSFEVAPSDKQGRDFRARGRLQYTGEHYLRFAQTGQFFFKAGADSPETFLAYADFDGTVAMKENVPLKTWQPHVGDWNEGDPVWRGGKGKGIIGAVNYIADKGVNAISFLTYNQGGDGDNVWPFASHNAKLHYDCSKLDQWAIVIEHMQHCGVFAHFKLQETENDDNRERSREERHIEAALDGGALGPERKLNLREIIARFGHNLALNWNLGEENTQTPAEQRAMAEYIHEIDPYDHSIVIHTYPGEQEKVYNELIGDRSWLNGASLQNGWDNVHKRTLKWVTASAATGRRWVVANDEQGSASEGVPPDPEYAGFEGIGHDLHDIRKQVLWGNLMAGGAGVEYYFGYRLPQNDLLCEDYRSRDRSWDFCRVAIEFFDKSGLPFNKMTNRNDLVGNPDNGKEKYCLAVPSQVYLVYLAYARASQLDLSGQTGRFQVRWFNPRAGGDWQTGSVGTVEGGSSVSLGDPPAGHGEDWLAIVSREL